MELPEGIGPFEKWPGYIRLRDRLAVFMGVVKLNNSPLLHMEINVAPKPWSQPTRVSIQDLEIVVPTTKTEFFKSGNAIRVTFTPNNDESRLFLESAAPDPFKRHGVLQVSFWAHTSRSNNVSAVYMAQVLNTPRPEIYLQSLSENRYEIGLNASGNLFDTLLFSDEMIKQEVENPPI